MVVDDTADKEDPAAPPGNEPDALSNVKSTAETGRIDGFAGVNGYDGIWHPADKSGEGDDSGDNAGSDPAAQQALARKAALLAAVVAAARAAPAPEKPRLPRSPLQARWPLRCPPAAPAMAEKPPSR